MPAPDHRQDLYVSTMVYNRLPFLDPTSTANETLIGQFTFEVMLELEPCFEIDKYHPATPSNIGNEAVYTIMERSIIADIVSVYILMAKAVADTGGKDPNNPSGGGTGTTPTKFLSEAKAGSVQVKWSMFDITKNANFSTNTDKMIDLLMHDAMRKGHKLGCIIDLCADCILAVERVESGPITTPFNIIVSNDNNCGC